MSLNESIVEDAAISWFAQIGYTVGHGPNIAPAEPGAERTSFADVILKGRLRDAIHRLNPQIPGEAQEEALRKVLRLESSTFVGNNRAFHKMLRDGVEVEYRRPDGSIAGDQVRLLDFLDPAGNDWFVVNQFTVIEAHHNRRPDVVVFVNGLPLAIIELKNAADSEATIWSAYSQLQTYKAEIPSLLKYNELLIVSDGLQARIGSLTANQEWFKVWRSINGEGEAPRTALELEVLIRGVFEKRRFLDLLQHFIVFEEDTDSDRLHKIIAGYHQFHAVNAAVEETVRASGMMADQETAELPEGQYWAGRMHGGKPGDRRAGVVWHTQGSGKSFSMLFYAARVVREPAMRNPTIVVLTDRNDLDDQLFGQFQRCYEQLNQMPVQARDREHLRELLKVSSGGVIFTTIQKFMPDKGERMFSLSDRRNIIVIADEAHRSQYDLIDGLARNLRDALATYTESGGTGAPSIDTAQAIAIMLEKYEVACDILHGFDWGLWTTGTGMQRLSLIPAAQEHVLEQEDGKQRFIKVVTDLSRAFALCAASDEATDIRDDVAFMQAIQAALNKQTTGGPRSPEDLEAAIRQLVSQAIVADGQIIDVFTAAGLKKPDISILSDQFLAEVRGLKHRNVAAELLEKLLKDEIKVRSKRNLVQAQLFSDKLKQTLNAYHNRAIATHEVIEELIRLAKEMEAAQKRGEELGLTDDEIAFYDALATNGSAVTAMGDEKLKVIAAELIKMVRKSVTIDWNLRDGARAKIRVIVKRILNKWGYPPDLQEEAVKTVLQQAELLCADWSEGAV